jgi:aryl-alcohol dehydrogenase-like predicted oxidoreductase
MVNDTLNSTQQPVQRRDSALGKAGLVVPRLAFGTATFGGGNKFFRVWGDTQQEEANRLVAIAIEGGVNFFDTANSYSDGLAEQILGTALKGKRGDVILASKIGTPRPALDDRGGAGGRYIMQAVNDTLARLQTDYLDLYYVHEYDATTAPDETLRALETLRTSGKVREIACSNFSGWHVMKAFNSADQAGVPRYAAEQVSYSLALRDVEQELMPLALDQGLGLIAYSPLGGGALAGTMRRSQATLADSRMAKMPELMPADAAIIYSITDALDAVAAETGKSYAQIALNWVLARPGISAAVFGARSELQLRDNLGALGWQLTPHQIETLDRASEHKPAYPYGHQHNFPTLNPPPVPYYKTVKS